MVCEDSFLNLPRNVTLINIFAWVMVRKWLAQRERQVCYVTFFESFIGALYLDQGADQQLRKFVQQSYLS